MEENIALEVRFEGETQIYSPAYKTKWQDLLAMLKCSFDLEDIVVTYIDDEEDEIAVDTEEEYDQAKALASKCNNVLRLRVSRVIILDTLPKESPSLPETTEAVKRKRMHTPPRPEKETPYPQPGPALPSTPPIPVPPPRPKVPPRLNRTTSLPGHKQPSDVSGYVMKAMEELKQLNISTPEQSDGPNKEKEVIDQIVKGVLDGLGSGPLEKTRPFSWEPSQMLAGTRTPICSSPLTSEQGTKPKNRTPAKLVHVGITCDKCEGVITGFRYKCGHCLDFDLCEECEAQPGTHDPNHVFLKLKRPAYRVGVKSDGRVAPIFKHPIYADDDTPVWEYKIKKLEEKMARKAARAELKRKYREEKHRVRVECHSQVSPTKRERIEKMAEKQAEQIMAAASIAATPTTPTTSAADSTTEITPLLALAKYGAGFVSDGNLPDETHLQPLTKFVKSWIMINNGSVKWNSDTKLKYLWGNIKILSADSMDIPLLSPGEEGPICVDFEASDKPGHYQSHWRLTQKGEQFGHRVWCNIIVDKAEVLEPRCESKKTVQEELILPKVKEDETVETDSSENTPSSDMAHLQSDQSDSCSPTRMASRSDVLTAHDVFSFELLSIHDDQEADKEVAGVNSPAATTTPNNTPIVGLTPCISPIPQLDEKLLCRRVSEHSDLEIIRREDIPEIIETQDMVRDEPGFEMAQDGVAVAFSFSDEDLDDVESICSSSDSDMLDDYCVVPLPDCFDPTKPLDKSMILSRTSMSSSMTSSVLAPNAENAPLVRLPSYEESQAELGGSTTPQASALIIQEDEVPQFSAAAEDITAPSAEQDGGRTEEIIQMEEVPEEEATNVAPSVDAILSTSNPALEITPLIPLVAATPVQTTIPPSSPKPTTPSQETVTMAPMPEITLLASPVPTQFEEAVLINPEGSVMYATRQPEVVRETRTTPVSSAAEGTNLDLIETTVQPQETQVQDRERHEEHDDEFHDAQDVPTQQENTQYNNTYNDVQVEADPVDLLGYTAARAVEVAGNVVRQAFGTAASSVNALLRPQPIPRPAPYEPPNLSSMDQLIEMGFGDRTKNQQLLEKHNDDVSKCVQDLLQAEDNDWTDNRH
ncbi:next to BRCA1 gene 1 protein [Strongylocentrotus purpuratus]|uniref:Next to BRCA1 gene 1 protein n=1 Tax=Strongylocentrotus purpuratus TaxID=7668 RepID=A0A7M7N1M5_STRPU|nr:next to BRCA1 gene 1 protein [Strongylocentrotus purpuratus]